MAKEDTNAPEMVEKPNLEGVEDEIKEEPKVEESLQPSSDLDELKKALEAYNIKNPDDLSSLVEELSTYKKSYGDSRNEVGELRRQLTEIQTQLAQSNSFDNEEMENVDLEKTIEKAVINTWKKIQQQQAIEEEKYLQARAELSKRPNWENVQPQFDAALQDPTIRRSLVNGQLTLDGLYSRLSERFLMTKVQSVLNQLPEGVKIGSETPDTPTTDRVPGKVPAEEEKRGKIEKAKDLKDVDGVVKNLFTENDPILRY
jgi:hypothetical protein